MKNPNWQRDELILALDLYFDLNNKNIDKKNPKVIALSVVLNKLPIHENLKNENFRNPSGVAMKLNNLRRFDPDYEGAGLERGGKLEESIWNEFKDDRLKLKGIADKIKGISESFVLEQLYFIEEDNDEFLTVSEGNTIYKLHKFYERDQSIIKKKKKQYKDKNGKLDCEICSFDFLETYGEIGKGFIECHHIKPLYTIDEKSITTLDDLILVCSNCHRMLHRRINQVITHQDLKVRLFK